MTMTMKVSWKFLPLTSSALSEVLLAFSSAFMLALRCLLITDIFSRMILKLKVQYKIVLFAVMESNIEEWTENNEIIVEIKDNMQRLSKLMMKLMAKRWMKNHMSAQ